MGDVSKVQQGANRLDFTSEDFDHAAYERVARLAALKDISLVRNDYETKIQLFWSSEDQKFRKGFSGQSNGCNYFEEEGALIGGYQWSAEIKSGRQKALKLRAEYVLMYGFDDLVEDAYAQLYFEKVARFTSYPYFRALFSHCSSASGLALDPLPSLVDRVD